MAGAFDTSINPFKDAFSFFSRDAGFITIQFLKIALLGLLVQGAALIIALEASALLGGGAEQTGADIASLTETGGSLASLAAVLIILLAFGIVNGAVSATAYNVVDDRQKKKRTDIFARTKELLLPMAKYTLVLAGVLLCGFAVAFLPAMLAGEAGVIIGGLFSLIMFFAFLGIIFFIQFSIPLIAIKNADVIESFRTSYRLVKDNLWTALLFDILLIVALIIALLVLTVLQGAANAVFASQNEMPILIMAFIAYVALSLLQSLLLSLILTLPIYFFWKSVSG